MKHWNSLQRTLIAAATGLFAFATPAMALVVDTPFGACVGGVGVADCVTAVGHISASVVDTLSINEMRAVSFGNMAVDCGAGPCADSFDLDLTSQRGNQAAAQITLLHGADANDGPVGGLNGDPKSGSQHAGHYTVTGGTEGGTTQVYISFADDVGNFIDISGDDYHNGASVELDGPGGAGVNHFTVDKFVINESGSDVYGHYVINDGGVANPPPGTTDPFDPGVAHTPGTGIDVVVGGTIHAVGAAGAFLPGKYTGLYNVMVSY